MLEFLEAIGLNFYRNILIVLHVCRCVYNYIGIDVLLQSFLY